MICKKSVTFATDTSIQTTILNVNLIFLNNRKPIVQLHTQIRQMVCQLRAREKAVFALQNDESLMAAEDRIERIEKEIQRLKEEINSKSEELDIRQRCLKEFQMMAAEKQVRAGKYYSILCFLFSMV